MTKTPPTPRDRALEFLQGFLRRSLPALERRLACWKGLSSRLHGDIFDDLHQELALDCLEHAELILSLSAHERHGRWFRLLQKHHYQLRLRPNRLCEVREHLDQIPGSGGELAGRNEIDLDALPLRKELRERIGELLGHARHLKNGRLNMELTAKSMGLRSERIRELWQELARVLGYGYEYRQFWSARMVEALLALAADLLRDADAVELCAEAERRRPSPRENLRRISSIKRALTVHPQEQPLRQLLLRLGGRHPKAPVDPRQLLALAKALHPNDPTVDLWLFEAEVAYGDLAAAARCLRAARRNHAESTPLALARARLAEARGRIKAAAVILQRALPRHGKDRRIAASLARVISG